MPINILTTPSKSKYNNYMEKQPKTITILINIIKDIVTVNPCLSLPTLDIDLIVLIDILHFRICPTLEQI
jgi:hypothetical protein